MSIVAVVINFKYRTHINSCYGYKFDLNLDDVKCASDSTRWNDCSFYTAESIKTINVLKHIASCPFNICSHTFQCGVMNCFQNCKTCPKVNDGFFFYINFVNCNIRNLICSVYGSL